MRVRSPSACAIAASSDVHISLLAEGGGSAAASGAKTCPEFERGRPARREIAARAQPPRQ